MLAASLIPDARAVTLVHSNDMMGELEPCGCRSNPLGGMARKANWLKKLNDTSLIQLDAGDTFFATSPVPELLAKQAELQATYLVHAFDQVGHDAIVPGEKDFALGLAAFERLRKQAHFKFIAANLKRKKGGKFLDAHVVFTRKDENGKTVRVGVFGLVGEDLGWPAELRTSAPIAAAKKEVKELRKKCDFLVALTHQGYDADRALAEAVPGIDVIVGGHTQTFLQEPAKVGSTWILQSSFRNQYVGALPLKKPLTVDGYKLTGLDAGFDSPAEAPGKMDELVHEFKVAIAELNTKADAAMEAQAAPPEGIVRKFHTFPRCAECHLKQFDFWRKTAHANALEPLVKAQQSRNKECLTCHTVGLGDPKGFSLITKMAEYRPYKVKPEAKPTEAEADPVDPDEGSLSSMTPEELAKYMEAVHGASSLDEKIKVTDADAEARPLRKTIGSLSRAWGPVQCENCHQPGMDHPFSGSYSKKVEKTACLACHTAERAPEWYAKDGKPDWTKIEAKRALITCPAGNLEEE
jgi:hypothetical protein